MKNIAQCAVAQVHIVEKLWTPFLQLAHLLLILKPLWNQPYTSVLEELNLICSVRLSADFSYKNYDAPLLQWLHYLFKCVDCCVLKCICLRGATLYMKWMGKLCHERSEILAQDEHVNDNCFFSTELFHLPSWDGC